MACLEDVHALPVSERLMLLGMVDSLFSNIYLLSVSGLLKVDAAPATKYWLCGHIPKTCWQIGAKYGIFATLYVLFGHVEGI